MGTPDSTLDTTTQSLVDDMKELTQALEELNRSVKDMHKSLNGTVLEIARLSHRL